jgi:hypothetical protein
LGLSMTIHQLWIVPVILAADMHRIAEHAPAGEMLAVPGRDHLAANATWRWRPYAADCLTDRLARPA